MAPVADCRSSLFSPCLTVDVQRRNSAVLACFLGFGLRFCLVFWGSFGLLFLLVLFFRVCGVSTISKDDLCTPHTWRLHSCRKNGLGTGTCREGTWDRELGVGNWDRELGQNGGSKLGTGNLGQGTGGQGTGWDRELGGRKLGAGNWGQGTGTEKELGGRELGAANWAGNLGQGTGGQGPGDRELGALEDGHGIQDTRRMPVSNMNLGHNKVRRRLLMPSV